MCKGINVAGDSSSKDISENLFLKSHFSPENGRRKDVKKYGTTEQRDGLLSDVGRSCFNRPNSSAHQAALFIIQPFVKKGDPPAWVWIRQISLSVQ